MTAPVAILGCGMMTGVGLTAAASCAAIRGRLDNFKETRFIARGGEWIIGSEVPLEQPWRGIAKLARLLAGPLRECLDLVPEVPPESIPVLLCVAEEDRPGRLEGLGNPLFLEACGLLRVRFHPNSQVIAQGRVGGAVGLHRASRMIREKGFRRVIVAGVDSYLVAATLRAYGDRERLLTSQNSNGFIPGEAGAAVLVGPDGDGPGVTVLSFGLAVEKATIESDEPLRGEGLAAAYRQALDAAGLGLHEIDYRIADLSGEQYWFKEAAYALARVMRTKRDSQEISHPADCLGEVGAAAMPALLSVVLTSARKHYAPGPLCLAQAANDDGRRITIVLDGSRFL
jgi:3-oxoacyl-[acyl-carrier-protein] synthase-1